LTEEIGESDSLMEQRDYAMTLIDLRRSAGFRIPSERRTRNLPIRGSYREWVKTLFSVPFVALW
jgi:hypothetical protein